MSDAATNNGKPEGPPPCPICGRQAGDHTQEDILEHGIEFLAHPTTTPKDILLYVQGQVLGVYEYVYDNPANPKTRRVVLAAMLNMAHQVQRAVQSRVDRGE